MKVAICDPSARAEATNALRKGVVDDFVVGTAEDFLAGPTVAAVAGAVAGHLDAGLGAAVGSAHGRRPAPTALGADW